MAVMVSATHTLLLTVYIVVVSWKHIVWKEFGFIALNVLIGLPAGFLLFQNLDDTYLKMILSLFMIGVGINGLRRDVRGCWQVDLSRFITIHNLICNH